VSHHHKCHKQLKKRFTKLFQDGMKVWGTLKKNFKIIEMMKKNDEVH
jgi:hypothetical protein